MANPYYNHGTWPATSSAGASALARQEMDAVTVGFSLLPTLAGQAGTHILVNSAGTALVNSSVLVETAGLLTVTGALTVSGAITGALTGNAATATKLLTPRAINGVNFDGTAPITVADATKLPLTGGTLTGLLTLSPAAGVALLATGISGSDIADFFIGASGAVGVVRIKNTGVGAGTKTRLQLDDGTADLGYLEGDVNGTTVSLKAVNRNTQLDFWTGSAGGAQRMLIDNTGNVGVNAVPVAGVGLRVQSTGLNPGWEFYSESTTAVRANAYNRNSSTWADAHFEAATYDFGIGGAPSLITVNSSGKLTMFGGGAVSSATSPTRFDLLNTNVNAATRNWSFAASQNAFGDFVIRQSTAQNGDPINAGTDRFSIAASGDITGLGIAISRVKTATTSRASTTARVDDPHLVAPLSIGTWNFDLLIPVWATTGGAGGLSFIMAFSGTGAVNFQTVYGAINGSVSGGSVPNTQAIGGVNSYGAIIVGSSPQGADFLRITGQITVTGAGNLSLQWAQTASNANAANIGAGGWMNCTKVG